MPARITMESALLDIAHEYKTIIENTCEDRETARRRAYRRAAYLYKNCIDVIVEVANNEQLGYVEKDIQLPTVPMKRKTETGERQTADYVVKWKWTHEPEKSFRKMGIIFERKAIEDFHQTIIQNYKRFDREINRFLDDPDTILMLILVEAARGDALVFTPPTKRYSGNMIKNMIAAKIGAVASIEARTVHVCWQGSRKSSANSIHGYVEQFFEKNYDFVLRKEIQEIWDKEEEMLRMEKESKEGLAA